MAIDALRMQKAAQDADRERVGEFYCEEGAVFADELGHRLTPKAATNGFTRLARKAGISTTRLHRARHTAATTMLSNGVDPTTAAAILGHSSPTVTLQVYSHLVPGAQRGAMDRLGTGVFCHWMDPSRLSRTCPPNRISFMVGFGRVYRSS